MVYAFGVPNWLVHSIHLLAGMFLLGTGNNLRMNRGIPALSKQILVGLGAVSALYQAYLWYLGGRQTYSYNLPAWVVRTVHILNGLLLVSLGLDGVLPAQLRLSGNNAGLYLIVVGALAAAYHLHLWIWG